MFQMLLNRDRTIERFIARYFLEKLRPPNQQIASELAGIESLDEQLQQPGMRNEQFEKQTAQTVGFDEANKLIERAIGISSLRQAVEQERTKITKKLTRA